MRLNVDGLLVYFPYDYIYPEQESHPVYTCMCLLWSVLQFFLANEPSKIMIWLLFYDYFLLSIWLHLSRAGVTLYTLLWEVCWIFLANEPSKLLFYDYIYPEQERHPVFTFMWGVMVFLSNEPSKIMVRLLFYDNIYSEQERHPVFISICWVRVLANTPLKQMFRLDF